MWTSPLYRRHALATRVLQRLESAAWEIVYAYLTLETGPRQPEAAALCACCGYSRIEAYLSIPKPMPSASISLVVDLAQVSRPRTTLPGWRAPVLTVGRPSLSGWAFHPRHMHEFAKRLLCDLPDTLHQDGAAYAVPEVHVPRRTDDHGEGHAGLVVIDEPDEVRGDGRTITGFSLRYAMASRRFLEAFTQPRSALDRRHIAIAVAGEHSAERSLDCQPRSFFVVWRRPSRL